MNPESKEDESEEWIVCPVCRKLFASVNRWRESEETAACGDCMDSGGDFGETG